MISEIIGFKCALSYKEHLDVTLTTSSGSQLELNLECMIMALKPGRSFHSGRLHFSMAEKSTTGSQ